MRRTETTFLLFLVFSSVKNSTADITQTAECSKTADCAKTAEENRNFAQKEDTKKPRGEKQEQEQQKQVLELLERELGTI